jgi:hypothetical protein
MLPEGVRERLLAAVNTARNRMVVACDEAVVHAHGERALVRFPAEAMEPRC